MDFGISPNLHKKVLALLYIDLRVVKSLYDSMHTKVFFDLNLFNILLGFDKQILNISNIFFTPNRERFIEVKKSIMKIFYRIKKVVILSLI